MEQKIILDANIWVSIFLGRRFRELLEIIVNRNIQLIADNHLRNELLDVISREKFKTIFSTQDIVEGIAFFDMITIFVSTKKEFIGSPDVNDNYLFDLAIQSNTAVIVTGDKKLLSFEVENIKIITFSEFLKH
jgi:putative PIN family toxin of toxin-antitoxin system